MCTLDQAFFFYRFEGKLQGLVCIHVDDFLSGGTEMFASTMSKLGDFFSVGNEDSGSLRYIGVNIDDKSASLSVDQLRYVNGLTECAINKQSKRKRSDTLERQESYSFRALLGQLNWVAKQTRPDISFEVSEFSSVCDKARVDDVRRANKLVRYLKFNPVIISFPKVLDKNHLSVECYSDAAFGIVTNGGSQGGFIIFVSDGMGNN